MKPYNIVVPTGQASEFAVGGNYIRLKSASVPITFNVFETGESITLDAGDDVHLSPFTRLSLSHSSGIDVPIVFYVGNDTSAGSSKIGGSIVLSGQQGGLNFSLVVLTASVSLLALPANSNRRILLLQNKHASAVVWVGFGITPVNSSRDLRLKSGEGILFDSFCPSSAIYLMSNMNFSNLFVGEG